MQSITHELYLLQTSIQSTHLRCLINHDSSASLADALQYSESVLEVADVKAGHL
jgi:hypothetical protein